MRPLLLIIGGMVRSGTTLTREMFAEHSCVHTVGTEWAGYHQEPGLLRKTGLPQPSNSRRMERLLEKGLASTELSSWDVDLDTGKRLARRFPASWDGFFLTLLEARHTKSPGLPIVIKIPEAGHRFQRVRGLVSVLGWRAKLLYLVRNPEDAYASFLYRDRGWKNPVTPHTDTFRWCALWLESTLHWVELSHLFPGETRLVQFESLLANPLLHCRDWCHWLGLEDRSHEMVLARGGQNSSFAEAGVPMKVGGVRDLSRRVRPELSEAELGTIRECCATRAAIFGYRLSGEQQPDRQRPFLKQHLALTTLTAPEYAQLLGQDFLHRVQRTLRRGYSRITGRRTTVQ